MRFSRVWKKGVTLITVLVLMVFVTLTIAAISYIFILGLKSEHSIATYKTTKEAAEAVGKYYASSGDISLNGTCTCNCAHCDHNCTIRVPINITGYTIKATLLRKCPTSSGTIYTIKIIATSKNTNSKTRILMIIEK